MQMRRKHEEQVEKRRKKLYWRAAVRTNCPCAKYLWSSYYMGSKNELQRHKRRKICKSAEKRPHAHQYAEVSWSSGKRFECTENTFRKTSYSYTNAEKRAQTHQNVHMLKKNYRIRLELKEKRASRSKRKEKKV